MTIARRHAVWALPVFLLAAGFGARRLAARAWEAFVDYRTPFAFSNPEALQGEPLVSRVVIALVDGLGYETSRAMPALADLRRRGADFEARAGVPSLSLPGRAVLMSGAWAEVHGQPTNFRERGLAVEHLFQTARKRGRRTALAAGPAVHVLFAPYVDDRLIYARAEETSEDLPGLEEELRRMSERVRRLLRDTEAALVEFDLTVTDVAGHDWGTTSSQYLEAAQAVDREIGRLAASLDLTKSVLVVTADHGHVPAGGHGGPEEAAVRVPLVMIGRTIRPGVIGHCAQIDVAPTVAALLGIEIPASNQGRVLLETLDLPPAPREAVAARLRQQRDGFLRQYVAWLTGLPPRAAAGVPGEAALAEHAREADRARDARLAAERRSRGGTCLGLLLAVIALIAGLAWCRVASLAELRLAVIGALLASALYAVLFLLGGLRYSFTAVNRDESLGPFFQKDIALAVTACALTVAALGAWRGRRLPSAPLLELVRVSWMMTAALVLLFALKMALVYWRQGVFLRWHMPDPRWGFGFYLDALAVMAVGLSGPALPALAWVAARLAALPLRARLPVPTSS